MTAITTDNLLETFQSVFGTIEDLEKHLRADHLRNDILAANKWREIVERKSEVQRQRADKRVQAATNKAQAVEKELEKFVEENFVDPSTEKKD